MPYANINGQRLYFEDSGGTGAPVILAHGFLMDHEMFAPQVAALAPEFRVITWDERGFGLTEFDGKPFTYWDSARDCFALLDHLGIDRAVVGGMSQGGFVSLRAALAAPERVRALVLLDTVADADTPEATAGRQGWLDMWTAVGPVDELAEPIAARIINEPAENARWIAKWRQRPKELLAEPGRCLNSRDDVSPAPRRDRLPRHRYSRHGRHRARDRPGGGDGRGAPRLRWGRPHPRGWPCGQPYAFGLGEPTVIGVSTPPSSLTRYFV